MNRLEAVIAQMVIRQYPELTGIIRNLKIKGASKFDVRGKVHELTKGSDLLWNSLSIAIDYIWTEHLTENEEDRDTKSSSTDRL